MLKSVGLNSINVRLLKLRQVEPPA